MSQNGGGNQGEVTAGLFSRPPCATTGLDAAAGFNAEEGKLLPPSPRRLRGRAPLLAARDMAAGPRRGCTPSF